MQTEPMQQAGRPPVGQPINRLSQAIKPEPGGGTPASGTHPPSDEPAPKHSQMFCVYDGWTDAAGVTKWSFNKWVGPTNLDRSKTTRVLKLAAVWLGSGPAKL